MDIHPLTVAAFLLVVIAISAALSALLLWQGELRRRAERKEHREQIDALRSETVEVQERLNRLEQAVRGELFAFHTSDFKKKQLRVEMLEILEVLRSRAEQSEDLSREVGALQERFEGLLHRLDEIEGAGD